MQGWMGKILLIDLTNQKKNSYQLPPELYHEFLGGRGLGVRLFFYFMDQLKVPPLNPDNLLIFATGPLTATVVPTSGRMTLTTRSPLTGTIFDSNAGGFFGPALKGAGYDALLIRGRAEKLTRLQINEGECQFINCDDLKHRPTGDTWQYLKQKLPRYEHLYIGPAGENKVKFATVAVGKNRTLGRGGLGAVLGSKNLKALSITGSQEPEIADYDKTEQIKEKSLTYLQESSLTSSRLEDFGTAMLVNLSNEAGILPTKNFQETQFVQADNISGEQLTASMESSSGSCFNCPIACARKIATDEGEKSGPEYESIGLLGPNLAISDPDKITELNHICNELGLDTISTGSVIACLMELSEKGYSDHSFSFADHSGLENLLKKIAFRQGLGASLAEGSLEFAREMGHPELAMQVKKLDIPAFDPRGMKGQALGYITSNRGACHLRASMLNIEMLGLPERIDRFSEQGKASLLIQQQDLNAILDSLIVCKFTLFALAEGFYREMLEAVTGLEFAAAEFYLLGARIWNLEKIYNLAVGFRKKDDTLPARFKNEEGSGPLRGEVVVEEKMLADYYQLRGWDSEGFPLQETLEELKLTDFSPYIYGGEDNEC